MASSEVTSLGGERFTPKKKKKKQIAYNETSCFHTGLWADKRPPHRVLEEEKEGGGGWRAFATAAATEEAGEASLLSLLFLRFAASSAEAAFPRTERALDEGWREREGVPLTSLSSSDMGSLDTNSFCSN